MCNRFINIYMNAHNIRKSYETEEVLFFFNFVGIMPYLKIFAIIP